MQLQANSTGWTGFVGTTERFCACVSRTRPTTTEAMPKTKTKSSFTVGRKRNFRLEAPEVSIFLACLASINELRSLANTYDCGGLTRTEFSRESSVVVAELNQLAAATERFDILCPVMEFGSFSPFFWRWFNWWNDYLKELKPRQISYLEKLAREEAPALSTHRPNDDWVRYRHTPAFALVIS
jgi:hypothetical protein